MKNIEKRILVYLNDLYPPHIATQTREQIEAMVAVYRRDASRIGKPGKPLSQEDVILITYGDQFNASGESPLETLSRFYRQYLADFISTIHILPFYPYSSDDGFSIIDYRQVDPNLGTWEDIKALNRHCHLMFDAVINHISSQSQWFQGFLRGETPYRDYFITVDPGVDLSAVTRPRTLPLLTPVETPQGSRQVWTTFSPDQVDLNYANPQVLLEILAVLLFYIQQGAQIIRLDAIAFLWKEIGTSCLHLHQTHQAIKLMRAVVDLVAPEVILITETNVPHLENISYFGESLPRGEIPGIDSARGDEAQMVYQFPLAPLVLHTFLTGDSRALSEWAATLEVPYPTALFFNFIASHDGIGVRPVEGLLTNTEVQALVDRTLAHDGMVSYKNNPDGSQSVYELNITLYAALNNPAAPHPELDIQRFLASQAIMVSLAGVPGIYVHSLFGSPNCHDCVQASGRARSINRQKFQVTEMEASLEDPGAITVRVFEGYAHLLRVRRQQPAFHPLGRQEVLHIHAHIFGVLRTSPDEKQRVLCMVNVSPQALEIALDPQWGLDAAEEVRDLLSDENRIVDGVVSLGAYQVCWLSAG